MRRGVNTAVHHLPRRSRRASRPFRPGLAPVLGMRLTKHAFNPVAVAIAGLFGVAGCTSPVPPTSAEAGECTFRTGGLDRSFCRHSMIQLLATPERFHGKPIYTYGYLELGPDGSAGLAPTPATFVANDTVGCIQVTSYSAGPREDPEALSQEGMYVVQIAGDLSPPENGLCAGRLGNATITGIRRLEP